MLCWIYKPDHGSSILYPVSCTRMSRFHSYISSASRIIKSYDGNKPLQHHLKSFFAAEKKYGSRDRKTIASLCYNYFRTGTALINKEIEEKILAGLFLSENKSNEMLALLRPEWNERVAISLKDKLALLHIPSSEIFPFTAELGEGIDHELFSLSFLSQPDLFIRARPGKQQKVADKLHEAGIAFLEMEDHCFRLANNTSLDVVLKINQDAVIQDYNSQKVFHFLKEHPGYFAGKNKPAAWDCCAASGGKSILLYDVLKGGVKLTVSDIREAILMNLENRLKDAGINIYKKFIADLSKQPSSREDVFNILVCDAPCTGSGTWSRTPEQLFYFKETMIAEYAERQKKIVSNIVDQLETGGLFFYITCSVFKQENENIVNYIKEKFHLPLLQMEYLKGYDQKADTMFVAVFSK